MAIGFPECRGLLLYPSPGEPKGLSVVTDGCALLDPLYRTVGLPRAQVTGCLVEVNALPAVLAGLGALRSLTHGAGEHLVGFGVKEVGETDGVRLLAHGGGNNLYPELSGFFHILIPAVQGIGLKLRGRKFPSLHLLNSGKQGLGIAFVGGFHGNVGNQVRQALVGGIGLHGLHLIPLPLVAATAGIGVRRALKGTGRNILVRLDGDRCPVSSVLNHALLNEQANQKLIARHGNDGLMTFEPLDQQKAVGAYLLELQGRFTRLYRELAVVSFVIPDRYPTEGLVELVVVPFQVDQAIASVPDARRG